MNADTTSSLIDTALASGAATALDPEERALQELVLALLDDAPTPAHDFRLRMDARVAAGFPPRRSPAPRVRVPAFALRRPRLAALGAAASLLIAVVVVGALIGRGGGSAHPSNIVGISAVEKAPEHAIGVLPRARAVPSAGGASESSSSARTAEGVPIAPGPQAVRGGSHRRVQRSAQLVLATPEDRLSQVGNQVVAVTDRYGGIVMSSSVTDTGHADGGGYFDLRIPARNLSVALRDLSQLADVRVRTENTVDVTASFVNAHTRIQELTAERKGLLNRLAHATTDNEAASIRAQLRIVGGRLDRATRSLQLLRRSTDLATVSLTLTVKRHHGSTAPTGIGKGWHDLRHSLVASAALALRVLGVAIPIALLAALLWAASGWAGRRRREAALDRI